MAPRGMYSAFLFGSESSSDEMAGYDDPLQQNHQEFATHHGQEITTRQGQDITTPHRQDITTSYRQDITTPHRQEITTSHGQEVTPPQGQGIATLRYPETPMPHHRAINTTQHPSIPTSHYSNLRTSQYPVFATPRYPEIPSPPPQATSMTYRQLDPSSTSSSAAVVSIPRLHQAQYFPSNNSHQSGVQGGPSFEQHTSLSHQGIGTTQGEGMATSRDQAIDTLQGHLSPISEYPRIPNSQLGPIRQTRRNHMWTASDKEIYTILYIGIKIPRHSARFGATFVIFVPNAPYQEDLAHLAKILAHMVNYLKNTPLAQAMTKKQTLSKKDMKRVRSILQRVSHFDLSEVGNFYMDQGSTTTAATSAAQALLAQRGIAQPGGPRPVLTIPPSADAQGSRPAQTSKTRDFVDWQAANAWGFGGPGSRYPLSNPDPAYVPRSYGLPHPPPLQSNDQHPSQTLVLHDLPGNQDAPAPAPHHPHFTANPQSTYKSPYSPRLDPVAEKSADANSDIDPALLDPALFNPHPVAEKSAEASPDIDPALIDPALFNPPASRKERLEAAWRSLL